MVKSQTIPPSVKKRITQADLARLTGVSQAVVSAVLNDNFKNIGVSPVVAKRIRLKAESLGYRVNSGARASRLASSCGMVSMSNTMCFIIFLGRATSPLGAGCFGRAVLRRRQF